jgi:perosamine synthetase
MNNFIPQIEPYYGEAEKKAIQEYLNNNGWLTEFKKTKELEKRIEKFLNVKHAIIVTSGTVGLYLAISACNIKNTKILVPDYTMIATPNSVLWAKSYPIFTDIEKNTMCLNINSITEQNCKAMIYVAINGRTGNMDNIVKYCKENNMFLIEDACQAFGSKYKDRYIGTLGDIGVFSLTPHKIITAGQGGIIVTDNTSLYNRILKLKDFGRIAPGVDVHDELGYNFKYSDLQSVFVIEQLKTIKDRLTKKKEIYNVYKEHLCNSVILLPMKEENVPWFIDPIFKTEKDRNNIKNMLSKNNIGTRVFYPPIHHQEIYKDTKTYPITESYANRGLWLPSSLNLTENQIIYICNLINTELEN